MPTRIKDKPVHRTVHVDGFGDLVVTIGPDGLKFRKLRGRKSVTIPFSAAVRAAFETDGTYMLSEDEWNDPMSALAKLSRIPRNLK